MYQRALLSVCVLIATGCNAVSAQAKSDDAKLKAFIGVCDQRLASHAFFSKVTMLKWTKNPPFVFYLERPQKVEKNYERMIVSQFLPFLERVLKIFEREYAKPLGLERRGAAPGFAIAVLNSKGSYLNYAQAVGTDSRHVRAHYDHRMQLAVTYIDTFGHRGSDERQSVLHEFIHALQHAYNSTGRMPRPSWFNEGLAEYHSACTNTVDSLENPTMNHEHLMLLASVLAYSEARALFAPLGDLISSESYADVLKRAKARGADTSFALFAFYAQSTGFVEFLRKGDGGKHRAQFLQFTKAVMRGSPAHRGFEKAFGKRSIPALEASFKKYIAAEATRRLQVHVGLEGEAMPAEIAGKLGVMPPPEIYDSSKLGWRDDEVGLRIAASRSRCRVGDYDSALALLPTARRDAKTENAALARRVRSRVAEILRLRDALLDKLIRERKRMAPMVDGKRRGGTLIARDGDVLTLKDRANTFTLPLSVLEPKNFLKELGKQKLIERASWQNAWLRFVGGEDPKKALQYLASADPEAAAVRSDLTKAVGPNADSVAAAALEQVLSIRPAKKPAGAFDQLDVMCEAIRTHRKSPLFRSRIEGLKKCVRALAQRAFSIDDPRCLGVSVPVKRTSDGRIHVEYKGEGTALHDDFRYDQAVSKSYLKGYQKLATSKSSFIPRRKFYELVGSGVFTWSVPLRGPLVLELGYEMTNGGFWGLMMSMQPSGGYIRASMGGTIDIFDPKTRLSDNVGSTTTIMAGRVHRLRIEFDGKSKLACSLDGEKTAEITRVGSLTRGLAGLMVHTSMPLRVYSVKISGKPDSSAAPRLREKFVERMLKRVK